MNISINKKRKASKVRKFFGRTGMLSGREERERRRAHTLHTFDWTYDFVFVYTCVLTIFSI